MFKSSFNHSGLGEVILETIASVRSKLGRIECLSRLQYRIQCFQGREYRKIGDTIVKVTKEGAKVVNEAIQYLKNTEKVNFSELEFITVPSHPLSVSSEDHGFDVGTSGNVSHTGSDGSHPLERMNRYGMWHGACGEVIWYGRLRSGEGEADEASRIAIMKSMALDIIDDLIIDDGVPSRGHRLALFDPRFKVGGVGISSHRVFGHVVVINMATAMLVEYEDDSSGGLNLILEEICAGREDSTTMKLDIRATLSERTERLRRREAEGPPIVCQPTLTAISTQWKDIGVCHRCRQQIMGGRVVEIPRSQSTEKKKQNISAAAASSSGRKFHADCFNCSFCSLQLTGGAYMSVSLAQLNEIIQQEKTDRLPLIGNQSSDSNDSALVCQSCYDAYFAPTCPHCMQSVTDKRTVKFKERVYHVPCFEEDKRKRAATDAVAPTAIGSSTGKSHSTGRASEIRLIGFHMFMYVYIHTDIHHIFDFLLTLFSLTFL